eukprot:COSAG02_NODE_1176_length_14061_cov_96.089529_10_plen_41_part_00
MIVQTTLLCEALLGRESVVQQELEGWETRERLEVVLRCGA